MLVIVVLATIAYFAVPRFTDAVKNAKINTCNNNIDILSTQWEAKRIETADYGSLSALTSDADDFPDGAPVCPFGTAYADENSDNRVDAHSH
jgi:hypothetical protein